MKSMRAWIIGGVLGVGLLSSLFFWFGHQTGSREVEPPPQVAEVAKPEATLETPPESADAFLDGRVLYRALHGDGGDPKTIVQWVNPTGAAFRATPVHVSPGLEGYRGDDPVQGVPVQEKVRTERLMEHFREHHHLDPLNGVQPPPLR